MGVWDTVGSVGFLVDRHLPFANQQAAKYFRQACALDEHRVKVSAPSLLYPGMS